MSNKTTLTAIVLVILLGVGVFTLTRTSSELSTESVGLSAEQEISTVDSGSDVSPEPETLPDVQSDRTLEAEATQVDVCADPDNRLYQMRAVKKLKLEQEALETSLPAILQQLSTSQNPEHVHIAILLESDKQRQVERYAHEVNNNPNDPVLLWHAVNACTALDDSSACPLSEWEQQLISIDGQNSEVWMRVAANRYADGDENGAYSALEQAGAAPESKNYYIETYRRIYRAFTASSTMSPIVLQAIASGVGSRSLFYVGGYTKMCDIESHRDAAWTQACLAYANTVAIQAKSLVVVSGAETIKMNTLEALGKFDAAEQLREKVKARQDKRIEHARKYGTLIGRASILQPEFLNDHIDNIEQYGEFGAMEIQEQEIERLLIERPELGCDQVLSPEPKEEDSES